MKKIFLLLFIIVLNNTSHAGNRSPQEVFSAQRDKVCLVTYNQNIASDSRIGSFNKERKNCIGILVSKEGLVLVTGDVYPVSLDITAGNGTYFSGEPSDFKVKLSDGNEFEAEFVGKDDHARVAFIQISAPEEKQIFSPVQFSPTGNIGVADRVFVLELLTSNYNFSPVFTPLFINSVIDFPRRKFLVNNQIHALSPGGLVLDAAGNAIGVTIRQIVNFDYIPPGEFEEFHRNYLEIAPSEWFAHLIKQPPRLAENEASQKSWLGIRMQGLRKELQEFWKVPQDGGIIVQQVLEESPAVAAGLKAGDIILAANDSLLLVKKDEDAEKLRNIVRAHPPGKPLKLKIFREGKILQKEVVPVAAPGAIGAAESYSIEKIGIELRPLTHDVLYDENLPLNTAGVYVYQADRASPAGLAGLQSGDILLSINGNSIDSFAQVKEMIPEVLKAKKKKIMLKVLNNKTTRFVFIDPEKF